MRTTIATAARIVAGVCVVSTVAAGQQATPPRGALPPATLGTAAIGGRVVIAGANPPEPVRRARVGLSGGVLSDRQFTDTDTQGYYRFDQLPAGAYRVRAEKPGFVSLEYGAARAFAPVEPIDLRQGQTVTANLALPRGAALEGHITSETGEPLQNFIVSAVRYAYGSNGRRPTSVQQARTDDLGRYRIHSLPAGEYYIGAAADPLRPPTALPGRQPPGFARTYYPGTPRIDEARAVRLATGADTGGLDFGLTSVPLAAVTVRVLDSSGKTPSNASARLQAVGGLVGDVRGFGDPQYRGAFMFRSVPPGDYWLMAAAMPSAPGDPEYGVTRVSIAGQESQFTVTTERGARIDGRIDIDSAAAPPPFLGLQVVAHETEFELPNPGGAAPPPATIAVGTEGRFLVPSLFGPRLIRLNRLPSGWAIERIWLGDTDISDTITDFRASNASRPMRIVLTDRTASVSGTVSGDRRRPVHDFQVVAFAEDEAQWTLRSRFVREARRSEGGRFTVDGLLPGKYLIAAIEPLDDESWSDPQVLRRLKAVATPLTLGEGDKQTIALTMTALP